MSENVEITKAIVSINAVMVDGKAMTVAVFEQIPIYSPTDCAAEACVSLGVVARTAHCSCGRRHSTWALVAQTFDQPDEHGLTLVRVPDGCPDGRPETCGKHTYEDKACERCREHREEWRQGRRHFAADQVYIAVGGTR